MELGPAAVSPHAAMETHATFSFASEDSLDVEWTDFNADYVGLYG